MLAIQKNKLVKILLDIIMSVLLVLLYNKRAINMSFHELGGLCVFGLFLTHKGLNWQWVKAVTPRIFRGAANPRSYISWIVNVLLFITVTTITVTGLLISKTLPTAVPSLQGAKQWHYFAAALSIVLVGVHLGLHWSYIRGMLKKVNPLPQSVARAVGILLLVLVVGGGSFSVTTGSFTKWISGPFHTGAAYNKEGQHPSDENGTEEGRPGMDRQPDGNQENDSQPEDNQVNGNQANYSQPEDNQINGSQLSDSQSSDKQSKDSQLKERPDKEGKGMEGQGERKGGSQDIRFLTILQTFFTYASEIGLFAVVTAVLSWLLCKKRKKTP